MKEIKTENAPGAIGPYSQGIQVGNLPLSNSVQSGNMIFVSGQLPLCAKTGEIKTEIKEATKLMLENMKAVLAESGATMKNVVKVTVFMSDLEMFTDMNSVYQQYFEKPYPARSCVQVARLPKDVLVEAECIAVMQ